MNKPAFVYVTYIQTTPEKVWEAIVKPEFTRQYWGDCANVSDWKQGSKWEHVKGSDSTGGCRVAGEVVESIPPKRLVFTWADPAHPDDTSTVSMDIEKLEGMVCLTVTHGEFKDDSVMADKISGGWPLVLSSMKSLLETGKAIDIRKA